MKKSIKLMFLAVFALLVFSSATCVESKGAENCYITSIKASHILVDTKEEADSIKTKISEGASFESMASKYSKCPSGKDGGDLGYFERGQMVKSFEQAAFNLPVGVVSDPVKTQFGWHLIKVFDKR